LSAFALFFLTFTGLGISLYPYVVPRSLTIFVGIPNAADSRHQAGRIARCIEIASIRTDRDVSSLETSHNLLSVSGVTSCRRESRKGSEAISSG
jgi:hypothetical protein